VQRQLRPVRPRRSATSVGSTLKGSRTLPSPQHRSPSAGAVTLLRSGLQRRSSLIVTSCVIAGVLTITATASATTDNGSASGSAATLTSVVSENGRPAGLAADAAPASNDAYVQPYDPARFTAGLPTDSDSIRAREILVNASRYAVTTWYNTVRNYDAQASFYLNLDFNIDGYMLEDDIRPPASEAYALAVSVMTGGYDAGAAGLSATTARNIAVRLTVSLARAHRVNTPGGWGTDPRSYWQSALWVAMAGEAGWMLWPYLSVTDREYVRKMVESEATRFIGWPVPYQKNRTGAWQNGHGCDNTAAEENAWDTRVLNLAITMMPQHSRRSAWSFKADELAITAFARPGDFATSSDTRGRPLGDWLEGSNINNDGTLVNHWIYHPDYMTTISEAISGMYVFALAGRPIPRSALNGGTYLYDALVDKTWVPTPAIPCSASPAFIPPGANNPTGTMYVDNSASVYYPEGGDWGVMRRAHFAEFDAMARAFGLDSTVAQKAAGWEDLHAQAALAMQRRRLAGGAPSDGRTYRGDNEDKYAGREEWVAARAAGLWLTKWLARQGALTTTNAAQQIVFDNSERGVTVAGIWSTLTASNPEVLGASARWKAPGTGSSYARFAPRLSVSRTYDVYAWWVAGTAQATNTPFTIRHGGVNTIVAQNQQTRGGVWVLLGTYAMGPGDYVQISDNANGNVVADGVLLNPR
jgi:hypothetical protein